MENEKRHCRKCPKIRGALGCSQEYVAKKMHLSQQSDSPLERHPEEAPLTRLKNLSEVGSITGVFAFPDWCR